MKRHNLVVLQGTVLEIRPELVSLDGVSAPAVFFVLETDKEEFGGRHQCVAFGRLALELMAFRMVAGDTLEVTLNGWLRSDDHRVLVVADRVMYHVPEGLRAAAAAMVRRFLEGGTGPLASAQQPAAQSAQGPAAPSARPLGRASGGGGPGADPSNPRGGMR